MSSEIRSGLPTPASVGGTPRYRLRFATLCLAVFIVSGCRSSPAVEYPAPRTAAAARRGGPVRAALRGGADAVNVAPARDGQTYALSSGCKNSGDRNTFRDHADHAAGANVYLYLTGADIANRIKTLKNVKALYIYGHGSENGLDADGWTSRPQPGRPERPYGMMRGLYRQSLHHTDGSMDQQSVTFMLDRAAGARNFSDLADAIVAAGFHQGATVYFASCHGEQPARMLSRTLQTRGRGDIYVVGANDWSNGSNPKFMSARPGCYLYFRHGKPEMIAGHQRSIRTLP